MGKTFPILQRKGETEVGEEEESLYMFCCQCVL